MAGDSSNGGGLDLEKELSCSICTEILYQPLTLLDCLHTFCGSCLQEWFTWQRASAIKDRRVTRPYTCPSCRESVRATKADWRLSTLLEGYLRANPDRGKTEQEKEDMCKHYKPGDDVLPEVHIDPHDEDSEDERLIAEVREMSMASVNSEANRSTRERANGDRHRRRQERRASPPTRHTAEEVGRQQQSSRWVAQQASRRASVDERQVEHQPSLRSLLSGSDISSEDVQEEILQSIYAEGLLNGIDIDNLTPAQEEELTERIAEAYRRRQRHRDRSRNRDRGDNPSHSSHPSNTRRESPLRAQYRSDRAQSQLQQPARDSRARPPISRPHLFEHTSAEAEHNQRRSASSTSHRRVTSRADDTAAGEPALSARSQTDALQIGRHEDTQRSRHRASSSNARSTTDPAGLRNDAHRVRASSALHADSNGGASRPVSRDSQDQPTRGQTDPSRSSTDLASTVRPTTSGTDSSEHQIVRSVVSTAAFAPEAVQSPQPMYPAPLPISCSRCHRSNIETKLHYNCSKCDDGSFNLCLQCYRGKRGCLHWFGFGFEAMSKWQREAPPEGYPRDYEYPHILTPRRYKSVSSAVTPTSSNDSTDNPEEGAFCESCFQYANHNYWYCEICLDGAWGFCNTCVLQGHHCTHPLLPLAHISTQPNSSRDPTTLRFLPLPHLKPHSYVHIPALTACDICTVDIPPHAQRYHCHKCSNGDYDICTQCYHTLVATGKISASNGPNGWRRCLQNHRMAIIGYQETPYDGGQLRITISDPVGGWRLKDDVMDETEPAEQEPNRHILPTSAPPPQSGGTATATATATAAAKATAPGQRSLASWSWFPSEENRDELVFPRNAEIRECEDLNADWAVGVYAGRVGVFPSNHTRKL